jgi:hypothetical protein
MKCLSQWCEKHESMFLIVGFCAKQILGIVGSQFEMERIFSLVGSLLVIRNVFYNLNIWTN